MDANGRRQAGELRADRAEEEKGEEISLRAVKRMESADRGKAHEFSPHPELAALLTRYEKAGGVLEYVFIEPPSGLSTEQLHRAAALSGMAAIAQRREQWAEDHASKAHPVETFFKVRWDPAKPKGKWIPFREFWGTDDVTPKRVGKGAWSIPAIDGYKPAFFHPPYGLQGSAKETAALFTDLNRSVLGADPTLAEVFSWSTDWSNYFDDGHEWWGAYYWTIRPADAPRIVVIAASATD